MFKVSRPEKVKKIFFPTQKVELTGVCIGCDGGIYVCNMPNGAF